MVDLLQRPPQFTGPGLPVMLIQFAQFAQQVSIAQCMFSRKTEIGTPGVVNHDARKVGQHASRFKSRVAALLVQGIERSPRKTGHVKPVQLPIHLCACFIRMKYSLLPQASFQVVLERLKAF
ncbi:hypothetical protein DRO_C0027 (plasmid) [Deinococcus radiodurans R1 = ATCC 13939 = DSM 20539]|nr:hypothetical protein DRO_C0027 [Deinococcus radiodurans R1 = ATCC 13939 = DSM 20539]